MAFSLKPYLPNSLFGRAALILIAPVITLQFIVSVVFIQRHYDNVTRQLTSAVVLDMQLVLAHLQAPESSTPDSSTPNLARALDLRYEVLPPGAKIGPDRRSIWDLAGRSLMATLHDGRLNSRSVDLVRNSSRVFVAVDTPRGVVLFNIARGRFSASNPHQLLVLMVLTGGLMTLIAFVFLRNQLTPITRLAAAATAFGRGEHLPYVTRGATEVRVAGQAFLAMRARIERQIESRTLMLSGISHDLRSPLTRLKLGITLLPQDDDTAALLGDIRDMERLVDEFLAFARGDAMEEPALCHPADVLQSALVNAIRAGQAVTAGPIADCPAMMLRPLAVTRALENLMGNAVRYGKRAQVSLRLTPESVRFIVEDDGPGIAQSDRALAMEPFQRLDAARDPNHGGGVGLGLAIASDIARSHGGSLALSVSPGLGGLRAELSLPR